jgi:Flp pilus assembly pilin Flp
LVVARFTRWQVFPDAVRPGIRVVSTSFYTLPVFAGVHPCWRNRAMKQLVKQPSLTRALRAFHDDEGGMQSIEAVVLLAVSAVIVVGIYALWNQVEVNGGEGILGGVANLIGSAFTNLLGKLLV